MSHAVFLVMARVQPVTRSRSLHATQAHVGAPPARAAWLPTPVQPALQPTLHWCQPQLMVLP